MTEGDATGSDAERIARLQAELAALEQRYAEAEATRSGRSAVTARRGPISLIAVCLGVALVVGVVAAVDLRRLQTPRGTALAWSNAAVFGDCTAYRELSLADDGGSDADSACLALRQATERNREAAADVGVTVVRVEEQDEDATATVRVALPDRPPVEVALLLRRAGDGWAVDVTPEVCAALPCP